MSVISIVIPSNHLDLDMDGLVAWVGKLDPKYWEIVLVVDELRKDFSEQIDLWRSLDLKLVNKVIRGKFGNPGDARNQGLMQATGRWVVFWDSDDIPNAAATLRMIQEAEKAGADVAIGSFKVMANGKVFIASSPSARNQMGLLRHLVKNPGIWRFCFLRESLNGVNFPSLRMGEDQIFLAMINFSRSRIFLSSEVIYEYHATNTNSLTNNNEAVSELERALYFLGNAVRLGKTNKLGVYLLARMLITFVISVRRKKILTSYKTGLILVKHSLGAILKSVSRKNPSRLTIVK
jgi:glycosyltransferase involved in cell wall biosynthesis